MSYNYRTKVSKIDMPRRDDVYLARVPGKNRPIVILDVKGSEVKYLICTTQVHDYNSEYEILDRASAGLNSRSFIARSSVKSMNVCDLIHKLGHLSSRDRLGINVKASRHARISNGNYDETWQKMVMNRYQI